MAPIRILVLDTTGLNPATWWRLYAPMQRLREKCQGKLSFEFSDGSDLGPIQKILLFDLVIFHIALNERTTAIVQAARDFGKPVILDVDDDVFNLDPSFPAWADYKRQEDHMKLNFSLASEVWLSSRFLFDTYKEVAPRRRYIPNGIDPQTIAVRPRKEKSILWRGNHHQIPDFHFAESIYQENKAWPDRWYFFGYLPPWADRDQRNHFRPAVPIERYFKEIEKIPAGYLWKPLCPNRMSWAKTPISWIEATKSGRVCVSNMSGRPEWENCFATFEEAEEGFEPMWKDSAERIGDDYDLDKINENRLDSIMNLHLGIY